jgi:CRISPR-associated protein Cas5t/CRISPR-associated protein Cas5h
MTLSAIRVHVRGLFNSFKPKAPEDIRYHRTLQLPPRTTLLGFAGAALGLGERELYIQWNNGPPLSDRLQMATKLNEIGGYIQDYWTIVKFVDRKEPFRAIQVREQLFRPSYTMYFASADEELVKYIKKGIVDPRYPLSLGRDDELVRVIAADMCVLRSLKPPFMLSNILMPLDIIPKLAEEDRLALLANLARFKLARCFDIGTNGTRKEKALREYAQLTTQVRVVGDVEAYTDAPEGREGNNFVFL